MTIRTWSSNFGSEKEFEDKRDRQKSVNYKTDKTMANKMIIKDKDTTMKTKAVVTRYLWWVQQP